MAMDEQIYQYIQQLSTAQKAELLDFIQYLLIKAEKDQKKDWSALSLALAMDDMHNEPDLYSLDDIKVVFS